MNVNHIHTNEKDNELELVLWDIPDDEDPDRPYRIQRILKRLGENQHEQQTSYPHAHHECPS